MKNVLFVTIPTLFILVLILEGFFRFVIPASKFPQRYFDKETNILRYNKELDAQGLITLGKFSQEKFNWTINNYGWNSSIDYQQDKEQRKRIAIIGDSYIEAFQVNNEEHLSRTLDQLMGDSIQVYSFGMSGSPLSQYLHVARYVQQTFQPDLFVVSVVHNDFDESLQDKVLHSFYMSLKIDEDQQIQEVSPTEESASKLGFLKRSALLNYLLHNLKIRESFRDYFKSDNEQVANANIYVDQLDTNKILLATDYVVKKFKEEFPNTRVIFMMDASRGDIYNGELSTSSVAFLEDFLKNICQKHGIEYIALSDLFQENYNQKEKRFNSQYDYHWNKYAHDLIANYLSSYLSN